MHRAHLRGVAYRMLGSTGEAEDAVQETWLRLSRSDAEAIANLRAWLTTVVGRVALDMLRARKARAEESAEEHHLEPIVSTATEENRSPAKLPEAANREAPRLLAPRAVSGPRRQPQVEVVNRSRLSLA
jgi:RNA polymerase sigma-70 factor (ECF subfamily)